MPEQLLDILKYCLLALVWLFFLRVVRAVWTELRTPAGAVAATVSPAVAPQPAAVAPAPSGRRQGPPRLLVREPSAMRGHAYEIASEMTVGRAAGCQITLDDSYVSQLHARIFVRDGRVMVEDLGSTNGTYHNRRKVNGATVVTRGDKIQIGSTVMELA